MSTAMNPIQATHGTSDTTTYRTAGTAFPTSERAAWDFIIVNRGAIDLSFKKGPSTGPDALVDTDAWPRIIVPTGQTHTYSRSQSDTHFYLYSASSCLFSILCGSGE